MVQIGFNLMEVLCIIDLNCELYTKIIKCKEKYKYFLKFESKIYNVYKV